MNKDIDESLKYLFEEYKRLKLKEKKQKLTIEENETLGGLYFNKLFPMGIQAIEESIQLIRDGNAPKTVFLETVFSRPNLDDLCRDVSKHVKTRQR